jgi:hypothetical protein
MAENRAARGEKGSPDQRALRRRIMRSVWSCDADLIVFGVFCNGVERSGGKRRGD